MATKQMSTVLQRLRSTLLAQEAADLRDGELLECFVRYGESAALEALVRRHGPMVWGVCRRTLGHHHDAEDAFQATFLVLVRKAACIMPRELVGNWLYGVARQTALKARAARARRRQREGPQTIMPEPAVVDHGCWNDLQPLLDHELGRLPDKYRAVIVLCDLEGKSRHEAARCLGCPEGTIGSRLARARAMLAKRLASHGPAVSGAALGTLLSQNSAGAGVPSSVMTSTIKVVTLTAAGKTAVGLISGSVTALTEGVIMAMLLHKLKTLAVCLLTVSMLSVGGVYTYQRAGAQADTSDNATQTNQTNEVIKKDAARTDLERIQGTWKLTRLEINGVEFLFAPLQSREGTRATFAGDKLTTNFMEGNRHTFQLHSKSNPRAIDLHPLELADKTLLGIYRLDGDSLMLCFCQRGKQERPSAFENYWRAGSHTVLAVLTRVADGKPRQEPSAESGKAKLPVPPNSPSAEKTDVIRAGDRVWIDVRDALPNLPIHGPYQVEASGKVALGSVYGRIKIGGETLEQAEKTITRYLLTKINPPFDVQVARYAPGTQPQDIQALQHRVDELEKEVRALRSAVNELRGKQRH